MQNKHPMATRESNMGAYSPRSGTYIAGFDSGVMWCTGCKVTYNEDACKVYLEGKIVWRENWETSTKLWALPLEPSKDGEVHNQLEKQDQQANFTTHQVHNAYTMLYKESLIKYLHQCLFCPPKQTLIAAIKNNQLTTWPGLTKKNSGEVSTKPCTSYR